MKKLAKLISNSTLFLLTALTVFTVNSTCFLGLGQAKEPESLNRLKRI